MGLGPSRRHPWASHHRAKKALSKGRKKGKGKEQASARPGLACVIVRRAAAHIGCLLAGLPAVLIPASISPSACRRLRPRHAHPSSPGGCWRRLAKLSKACCLVSSARGKASPGASSRAFLLVPDPRGDSPGPMRISQEANSVWSRGKDSENPTRTASKA